MARRVFVLGPCVAASPFSPKAKSGLFAEDRKTLTPPEPERAYVTFGSLLPIWSQIRIGMPRNAV